MSNFFTLKEKNKKHEYSLYQCDYIIKNKDRFIEDAYIAKERFKFNYPEKSSTWFYRYYNATSLFFGSVYYFNFLKNFKKLIRKYVNTRDPLWYQMWLNFDDNNSLLDWHNHQECLIHGYVSIEPQNTITKFEEYEIKNKIGNIYIGKPYKLHKVVSLDFFKDKRITLGFDIIDKHNINIIYKKKGYIDINLSFIPIE